MKFKQFITEKLTAEIDTNGKEIAKLAQNLNTKDEFRAAIEAKIPGIEDLPKFSGDMTQAIQKVNSLPQTKITKKLLRYATKGTGAGEIYLAYLIDGVTIGGGSSTYDLSNRGSKYEVKMNTMIFPKTGYCKGSKGIAFRYGTVLKSFISKHVDDIGTLLRYLSYADPSFKSNQKEYLSKIKRGEIGQKVIEKMMNSNVDLSEAPIDVTITKNFDVLYNNQKVTNLKDKNHSEVLKQLSTSKANRIKSISEINNELQDTLRKYYENKKINYIFIDNKTGIIYLIDVLQGPLKNISAGQLAFVAEL